MTVQAPYISSMIDEPSQTATPNDRPWIAHADWEDEGGAQKPLVSQAGDRRADLAEEDERMLRRLGAAVILQWSSLPSHIQRRLFARALTIDAEHPVIPLNEQIARFLHLHKDERAAK
jgi:hypothetical protein